MAAPRLLLMLGALPLALCVPGNYISNMKMNNQILPITLPDGKLTPIDDIKLCEQHCVDHAVCDAFSYSSFHKICEIYKTVVGTKAVLKNMFKLYVLEKSTADGFHMYGTDYIKLYHQMKTAAEAMDFCATVGGNLIALKTEAMQKLVTKLMMDSAVFNAFIGITDKVEEGKWKYLIDDSDVTFTNWDWNGLWDRTDLNCAIVKEGGKWRHTNCFNKYYFFCQTPMF